MASAIPSRVQAPKGIRISQSNIPGAGRGLFATEEIKAGELIFSIAQPLLNIVATGNETPNICDHCFAIRTQSTPTVPTVPGESTKLLRCSGCQEVYYCNKGCQSSAWKHHHKHECKIFVALKVVTLNGVRFLEHSGIRCLVRFFLLHPLLPPAERAEYAALQTHRSTKIRDPCFLEMVKLHAEVLHQFLPTKPSEDEVTDMYCVIGSNQLSIILPILKGSYSLHPSLPLRNLHVSGGSCLEPFAALLNHSCDPNSIWFFNGPSLNIRASSAIAAGAELTIPYMNTSADFQTRQERLLHCYHFTCTCPLCLQGMLGPTGALRARITAMIEKGTPESLPERQDIELAIAECKKAGFGGYPMYPLHLLLLSGYLECGAYQRALKLVLTLRYFVEPCQNPPTPPEQRLQALHYLIHLILVLNDDIPARLEGLMWQLQLHVRFREMYVRETERCYGTDSIVGRFEREDFEQAVKRLESITEARFVRWDEGQEGRESFYVGVNALLVLAQLPAIGEKDL